MLCDTDRDLGACDASQREGLVQVVKQIVAGLCYSCNMATAKNTDKGGAKKKSKGTSLGSTVMGAVGFVAKRSGPVAAVDLIRGKYNSDIKKAANSYAGTLSRYSTPGVVNRLATGNHPLTSSKARSEYKKNVFTDLSNVADITVAAKAAPGVVKAVKSTGAIPRIANTVTGKKVVVSGSPTSGIRSIKPTYGSPGAPNETVAWGWNPSRKGAKQYLTNNAQEYAQGRGSIYVAKTNKTATKFDVGSDKAITKSTKPMKVVKEISVVGKTQKQIEKEVRIGVREAGSRVKGSGAKGKVKQVKTRAKYKKSNKNSPI